MNDYIANIPLVEISKQLLSRINDFGNFNEFHRVIVPF
jgi:hypothetical protein